MRVDSISLLILFFFLLNFLCQIHGSKYENEKQLYDTFSLALGTSAVDENFGTPNELANSVDEEEIRPKAMGDTDETNVGCVNYNEGGRLAQQFVDLVHPFFLDRDGDLFCFYYKYDKTDLNSAEDVLELEDRLNLYTRIPAPLKVHNSLYTVVEEGLTSSAQKSNNKIPSGSKGSLIIENLLESGILNLNTSLDIDLSAEFFNFGNTLKEVEPPPLLWSIINSLRNYDLATFDTFYWSSTFELDPEKSMRRANRRATQRTQEMDKRETWNKFRVVLATALETSIDPCGFTDIASQPYFVDTYVNLPVYSIINKESLLCQACLAFAIASLSQEQTVTHLSFQIPPDLLNFRGRSVIQTGSTNEARQFSPYTEAGLLGTREIVCVVDSGLDESSCYFNDKTGRVFRSKINQPIYDRARRKVIMYASALNTDDSDEAGGHGTHVCGTVAGNDNDKYIFGDGKYGGIAPDAKIAFMDLANPGTGIYVPDTYTLFSPGYNAGARIQSHSWGGMFPSNTDGYYYGGSVDQFLFEHTDFVVLYAAGNSGTSPGKSLTRESTIKNAIAVGAIETNTPDNVAFFSSRGPCYDGRFKPDIVAPGYVLVSAKASGHKDVETCDVMSKAGTSMATPAAAASCALIRQYFRDRKFWASSCRKAYHNCAPFTPSGVLIKAILLHSATPVKQFNALRTEDKIQLGNGPDSIQGYGRVTLTNVLALPNGKSNFDLYVVNQVPIGEFSELIYSVDCLTPVSGSAPLKATLAWYDPPAPGKPAKALLHDLDLTIISPSGKRYLGNGRSDTVNNNEQVVVNSPESGRWRVIISTHLLPVGQLQKFSLVITAPGFTALSTASNREANLASTITPLPVPEPAVAEIDLFMV